MMKRLLEIKKKIKAKNPKFKRQDYHKWNRLGATYRKGKGMHSKMRHKKKGVLKYVQSGYRTPAAIRNYTKHGFKNITIATIAQLEKVNPKDEAITISKVGMKRRMELVAEATKRKIKVLNLKDDFMAKADKIVAERKVVKAKKTATKQSKEAQKKASAKKEDKKASEPVSDEEKKKKEKAEKDKVLTQKQ